MLKGSYKFFLTFIESHLKLLKFIVKLIFEKKLFRQLPISILNSKRKRKIKEYFINYLQVLKEQQKLQTSFLDLSSNKVLNIYGLNTSNLSDEIILYKRLLINFLPIQ